MRRARWFFLVALVMSLLAAGTQIAFFGVFAAGSFSLSLATFWGAKRHAIPQD